MLKVKSQEICGGISCTIYHCSKNVDPKVFAPEYLRSYKATIFML